MSITIRNVHLLIEFFSFDVFFCMGALSMSIFPGIYLFLTCSAFLHDSCIWYFCWNLCIFSIQCCNHQMSFPREIVMLIPHGNSSKWFEFRRQMFQSVMIIIKSMSFVKRLWQEEDNWLLRHRSVIPHFYLKPYCVCDKHTVGDGPKLLIGEKNFFCTQVAFAYKSQNMLQK